MSKLVIKNLPENKELDRKALTEFKGGADPLRMNKREQPKHPAPIHWIRSPSLACLGD